MTRTIDGVTYSLALTDTAGQEEYRGLWSSSNLHSDAFLLVYDITATDSLHTLEHFNTLIELERETRYEQGKVLPICIVAGNKCDLQGMRQIGARDGMAWAKSRGYGFMETSAREMVNIEETFARKYTITSHVRFRAHHGRAVLVRRVRDARLDHARGIAPTLPTAKARTQPLEPLPHTDEKAIPPGPGSHSQSPQGGAAKQSFWSKLRCW